MNLNDMNRVECVNAGDPDCLREDAFCTTHYRAVAVPYEPLNNPGRKGHLTGVWSLLNLKAWAESESLTLVCAWVSRTDSIGREWRHEILPNFFAPNALNG